MKIIIDETPVTVTVDFEVTKAPCIDCRYFQRARDGDEVSLCKRADRPLSGKLIQECLAESWKPS